MLDSVCAANAVGRGAKRVGIDKRHSETTERENSGRKDHDSSPLEAVPTLVSTEVSIQVDDLKVAWILSRIFVNREVPARNCAKAFRLHHEGVRLTQRCPAQTVAAGGCTASCHRIRPSKAWRPLG